VKPLRQRAAEKMLETRSQTWHEAGLRLRQVDRQIVRRAWRRSTVYVLLIIAVLVVSHNRQSIIGTQVVHHKVVSNSSAGMTALEIGVAVALLILGWALASELGRAVGPTFFRRMDPATAGTVGFFTRLIVMTLVVFLALGEAGIDTRSLAIGATFVAVIFGLAAQQTLGNVIAGTVLLSARPFKVGERVRLQAGGVGGQLEGVVSSLGLLYTAFASGEDVIMVPNSVVLNSAIIPLREPDAVDLRARLRADVTPRDLQRQLEDELDVQLRDAPRITLEELDGDEVVVRIRATPRHAADGPVLATEVLEIVSRQTRGAERDSDRDDGPPADGDPADAITVVRRPGG
jgi:small-conductance mechanosensitive channel